MKRLAILACLLTVCITASSALIRHWQAGLGCEAWSACAALFPLREAAGADGARSAGNADRTADGSLQARADPPPTAIRVARLTHRASASAVGLLVALIALFGWTSFSTGQRVAAAIALADTAFLAWLGRYTPHDLPLVTVGNVAGGMALAGALAWIAASPAGQRVPQAASPASVSATPGSRAGAPAWLALLLMALLVFSGTMTSVRGAVDACPQLLCLDGARLEPSAFDPRAPGGLQKAGEIGMHLAHRGLALAFAAAALLAAVRARTGRAGRDRSLAGAVVLLLAVQFVLGLGTAFGAAPLATATLHNAVAAVLAALLAALAAGAPRLSAEPRLRVAGSPDRFAGT